jgi:hypothetical protein
MPNINGTVYRIFQGGGAGVLSYDGEGRLEPVCNIKRCSRRADMPNLPTPLCPDTLLSKRAHILLLSGRRKVGKRAGGEGGGGEVED